ncbi:MAG: alpha/beta hydrolase [Actinomycetota bacterium]
MILTVDGAEVHAATGGVDPATRPITDPVVVLVHGAGMDATVWQLQTRYLAHHGCRPIAVDLPGHGRSGGAPLTSIGDMADWLGRYIEALAGAGIAGGKGEVVVVGHSMGTFIGLELAVRRPELVARLVLLGTANAMPVHPDLLAAADGDLPAAAALMAAWGHAKPAHVGLNPTPGLWMLGGARALVEVGESGVLATDFRACMTYEGALDAAAKVGCPVAVAIGAGDKMTPPKAGAKLVGALESGDAVVEVVRLADTGHMMMVENPAAIRSLLVDALGPG